MPSAVLYDYQEPYYWYASDPYWDESYWDDTAHDTGGGDNTWNPDYTPPPECYPNSQKRCLTDLTVRDKDSINLALNNHLRTPFMIPDTAMRARCVEMRTMSNETMALNPPVVFRGAYNSTVPGTDPAEYDHDELVQQGKMHIDPWLFDSATVSEFWRAQLAIAVLHGVLHLHNHTHTRGAPDAFFLPGDSARYGAQYNKAWFSDLNHTRDPWNWNSCVHHANLP
jgi:hypothetical protein